MLLTSRRAPQRIMLSPPILGQRFRDPRKASIEIYSNAILETLYNKRWRRLVVACVCGVCRVPV